MSPSAFVRPTVALAITLLAAAGAAAQCDPAQLITSPTPAANDMFATALSAGGQSDTGKGFLVIGRPRADTINGADAGAANIYRFDLNAYHWNHVAAILAPVGGIGEQFGAAVDFYQHHVIAGAPGVGAGRAYIFNNPNQNETNWVYTTALAPPDGMTGDRFGAAVGVTEFSTCAVVGAPSAGLDLSPAPGLEAPAAGKAYLYAPVNNVWQHVSTLTPHAGLDATLISGAAFGRSIAMSSDRLAIGAPMQRVSLAQTAGAVYVYEREGNGPWTLGTPGGILPEPGQVGALFGQSVEVNFNELFIGAPLGDSTAAETPAHGAVTDCGFVDYYRRENGAWVKQARIFAPDPTPGARFGESVADGFVTTIAAPGVRRVYTFQWLHADSRFYLAATVDAPAGSSETFASSVAAGGYEMVIADPGNDAPGLTNRGAAYAHAIQRNVAHDSCQIPTFAYMGASRQACTTHATLGSFTTCGGDPMAQGPDVWYRFSVDCDGPVTIDTFGSAFDTVLSVHTDCPPALTPANLALSSHTVACNDDAQGTYQSRVTFNALRNQTYLLRIAGYGGSEGDFVVNLAYADPPANDLCANAQPVTVGAYPYEVCSANTDGSSAPVCGFHDAAHDVWFAYTAPVDGTLVLRACNSNFYPSLEAFVGGCGGFLFASSCNYVEGACGNAVQLTLPVADNSTYTLRIAGSTQNVPGFDDVGQGTLVVAFTPDCACDWNLSGALSVQDIFDFLAAYFAGNGDFNGSGATTVQDIFDFLACYFGGCN